MSSEQLPHPFDKLCAKDKKQRSYAGGEVVFLQNDATAGLYFLISGVIDLRRTTTAGHGVIIHRAQRGTTFAEASLFSEAYHCTATARIDSVVIECQRNAIQKLLETDNEFSQAMIRRFAVQIQEGRRRVELLSIKSADERILMALYDGLLIEDIASFAEAIGLVPETAYRALAQLTKQGKVIKTARGQYQLSMQ